MLGKYLSDLGIKEGQTPNTYGNDTNDIRMSMWEEQREVYGFDERETWDLKWTFVFWLYERLKMFDEVNIINTKFHKFTYNGEELTLQQMIDRLLLDCEKLIKSYVYPCSLDANGEDKLFSEVKQIFVVILGYLWW